METDLTAETYQRAVAAFVEAMGRHPTPPEATMLHDAVIRFFDEHGRTESPAPTVH